jgi:hypothetical protein
MGSNGRLERGNRALYLRGRLGAGCTSTEAIGRGERWSRTALCTECSGQVGCVGGSRRWSQCGWFQCGCRQSGAWQGGLDQLWCNAGVACRSGLNAVHVHVRHEACASVCVRERGWRSWHPWRMRDMVRARAAEGPTAGLVGWQRLGNIDDGQRTLMARQQRVACLRRLCPHGHAPGRRQHERGRGVRCRGWVSRRWDRGASPGWRLIADWGLEGGRVRERE